MADGLVSNESPLEFFKAQVEDAMERQHLKTSVWTSYYIVQMLAGYVARRDNSTPGLDDEPLGLRLARALQAEGAAQREELRSIGDSPTASTDASPTSTTTSRSGDPPTDALRNRRTTRSRTCSARWPTSSCR